jgi:anti-sigma regulatory factor (Ser/Thr protein kinase)
MAAMIELASEPSSVGSARRFCAQYLVAWGASRALVDTATLLVSELVTNAILHARTPVVVSMRREARLRVEVHDGDCRAPVRKGHDHRAASGRGLLLVDALSAAHGTDLCADGKRVWFELGWEDQ